MTAGYRCDLCGKFQQGSPSAIQVESKNVKIAGHAGSTIIASVTTSYSTLANGKLTFHAACMKKINDQALNGATA